MSAGRVVFVGCGPGAADLLTLRAAHVIASADIVIWGRSLLAREAVDAHVRPDAEVIAWPPATMADVMRAYDRARDDGLLVARLKSGDPALFGEMREELDAVAQRGLAWEVVPGVSALGAAAAAARAELTAGGADVVVTRPGTTGDAAVVAVFMSGRDGEAVQRALLDRGLDATSPCTIAHRVSWPGELLDTCTVGELAERLADLGLDAMTVVIAGVHAT